MLLTSQVDRSAPRTSWRRSDSICKRSASLDSTEKKLVVPASSNAIYVDPGYLLYMRDGALVARRFDLGKYSVNGDAQLIQNDIQYLVQIDQGLFDGASNGTLIMETGKGGSESQLTWFDRAGKKMESVGGIGSFGNPSISPDGKPAC